MAERMASRCIACTSIIFGVLGCAGAVVQQPKPKVPAAHPHTQIAATEATPPTRTAPSPVAFAVPETLPDEVEAGNIPRPTLLGVLARGVGRFLQTLRAEPHLERGRFIGWRLVDLFGHDPERQQGVLRTGDTVITVNGQSIERPEQFKNVWDSLATERQLVLVVQRGGKQSQLRYAIVD